MASVIWWLRRDLRLTDNQALQAALKHEVAVVPVFILDPNLVNSSYVGEKRLAFLFTGLQKLDDVLHSIGSRLIVRSGSPIKELVQLHNECNATSIYAEADHSPYARRRDDRVKQDLPLKLVGSTSALPPGSVLKEDGSPYTVYTPFSKAWKSLPLLGSGSTSPAPEHIVTPDDIPSHPIPTSPQLAETGFTPGEGEAQARLQAFLNGDNPPAIYNYDSGRDMLGIDGTSKLSPHLRFGMLSPRQAVLSARQKMQQAPDERSKKGAETWLNELIWRDFYIHILHHFPEVREQNFRMPGIRWENDPAMFQAWCEGKTGYPVIDAAMRQLRETGWMHNRARMLTASFLTKDLLIDWRWGERWFMQHLIDGDPAANNGGWQWTAGTGTDAAPYFRVFNPILQSTKFDPQGVYIRRWVEELASVPEKFIHQPWQMTTVQQEKYSCRIGFDYPEPIIDHSWARQRALEVYNQARNLEGTYAN